MLSQAYTWHAIMGQVDLMSGRGGVDRGRPLSVATATAGFPRGTDEGSNQLHEQTKRQLKWQQPDSGFCMSKKSVLTSFSFVYNTD